jgi:hypothetical protein
MTWTSTRDRRSIFDRLSRSSPRHGGRARLEAGALHVRGRQHPRRCSTGSSALRASQASFSTLSLAMGPRCIVMIGTAGCPPKGRDLTHGGIGSRYGRSPISGAKDRAYRSRRPGMPRPTAGLGANGGMLIKVPSLAADNRITFPELRKEKSNGRRKQQRHLECTSRRSLGVVADA